MSLVMLVIQAMMTVMMNIGYGDEDIVIIILFDDGDNGKKGADVGEDYNGSGRVEHVTSVPSKLGINFKPAWHLSYWFWYGCINTSLHVKWLILNSYVELEKLVWCLCNGNSREFGVRLPVELG